MPSPAGGSLHPANLLMLVFADLFGASDFNRELWGPPGFAWHDAFGQTGLYRRAEHRPDLCRRARRRRGARLRRGARTALGARDSLLHRGDGADAALCARQIHAGLSSDLRLRAGRDALPPAGRRDLRVLRAAGDARRLSRPSLADRHDAAAAAMAARRRDCRSLSRSSAIAVGLALWVGTLHERRAADPLGRRICRGRDRGAGAGAPPCGAQRACGRGAAGRLQRRRSRLEQCAERVDRAEAFAIRGAAPGHHRRNRHAAEGEAHGRRRARPPRPRRTDRRRLSLAEHRADPRLRSSVRAQSAAADGLRARHRRARHGGRRRPAAVSAADVVLSLDAGKPVRRALHRHRRAGRADRQVAQAGRSRSHRAHQGRLRLRKSARAAARDAGDGMAQGRFRRDDPRRRLAGRRSATHGAAGKRAGRRADAARLAAPRASCAISNTDIEIEADAPGGGFVVLNDVWHPWWRASVDDKPAEILKANVLFRAVVVPPGKHVVRFTFHPFSGASPS